MDGRDPAALRRGRPPRPPTAPAGTAPDAALAPYLSREVAWSPTGGVHHPWAAVVAGVEWRVRLNDFPDEIMYALVVDGAPLGDFHDRPSRWRR